MTSDKLALGVMYTAPIQAAIIRTWLEGNPTLAIAEAFQFPLGTTFQQRMEAVAGAMENFIEHYAPEMLEPEFIGDPIQQARTALERFTLKNVN